MGNLNIPNEFEELHSMINIDKLIFEQSKELIILIQKDAWNAAIRWAAENAKSNVNLEKEGCFNPIYEIYKQSILNGLIDD